MSNKIRCELCSRNKQFIKLSDEHRCICCDFRPNDCKHRLKQVAKLEPRKHWLMNSVSQKVEWLTCSEQEISNVEWQNLEIVKNPKFWKHQKKVFARFELHYCAVCNRSLVRRKRSSTKISFCSKKHQGIWLRLQKKKWDADLLNAYLTNFYLYQNIV